jgi:hypothetical protein
MKGADLPRGFLQNRHERRVRCAHGLIDLFFRDKEGG